METSSKEIIKMMRPLNYYVDQRMRKPKKAKRPVHNGFVDAGIMFIPPTNGSKNNVTSRRLRVIENPNSGGLVIDDRIFKNGAPMKGMGLQIGLDKLEEWNRTWTSFYKKAKQLKKNNKKQSIDPFENEFDFDEEDEDWMGINE